MIDPAATLFTTSEMTALFSAEEHVRGMLAFEAALARAQTRAGIIPSAAADAIARACRIEAFNVTELYHKAALAGTPAIPLVRMLTALVDEDARRYVHWGATSQDVIDTALVLQMRHGLALLIQRLLSVGEACATHAERHRRTPMAGRTLLQQAAPINFGLKAARWLGLVTRQIQRLQEVRDRISVIQFGGAVGTLAALGDDGERVAELLAEELGLAVPDLPWHAERDRIAEMGAALAVTAGSMGKIANDIVLLAQTEVGEVAEAAAPGKGGSSALPHKQNPVDAMFALAAAKLAVGIAPTLLATMLQEHERSVGSWQAEWSAIPALFGHTSSTIEHVQNAVSGLVINSERMRANLDQSHGLIMSEALSTALAATIGRAEAQRIVTAAAERAGATDATLHQIALGDPAIRTVLSESGIEQALDPAGYLGITDTLIDRALAGFRAMSQKPQ